MPRAAIDIGSNSVLLTILDQDGSRLHDEARVVGLGRGLGDRGLFAPDRMEAARVALADYVEIARRHGVEPWSIKAVATSAARRSMNAQTFFSKLQRKLGLRIRIISGDEEAQLTWRGALHSLNHPGGSVLVVDLGGGSTELVWGDRDQVIGRVSLEIGSVRLTEAFLGTGLVDPGDLARLRNHVDTAISSLSIDPAPRTVVGVAGTVTTIAARELGLDNYESDRVHGRQLSRPQLASFIDRFLVATPEQRRAAVPFAPGRADYLLAGAVVLDRILGVTRRPALRVSDHGVRYGLLATTT